MLAAGVLNGDNYVCKGSRGNGFFSHHTTGQLGKFFGYYSYYYYFRPGAPTATSMLPKMTANIEPTGENPTQWTRQNTWAA